MDVRDDTSDISNSDEELPYPILEDDEPEPGLKCVSVPVVLKYSIFGIFHPKGKNLQVSSMN